MSQDPRIGTELAGFRILSVLGRGGMSVVYLAQQSFPERRVALKLVAPELAGDERFRERFIRESNVAASLDHPNVLPVFAAGEAEGVLYIAMRFVEGTDLRALIRSAGRLSLERTADIVSPVAGALDQAHAQGLVHRDVKPANVLIASGRGPEDRGHVYLSDFGLTKRTLSGSGLTGTGQFLGSIEYAAPEQFQGKPLDARTDVYSLGCVAFECLAGHPPFPREQEAAVMYGHLMEEPPDVSEASPGLPAALDRVIARAMAKDPEDRYQRAGDLARSLHDASTEAVAPTRQTPGRRPPSKPAPPRRSRRRTLIAGAIGLAVILVAGLVWLAARGGTPAAGPSGRGPTPGVRPGREVLLLDPLSGRVERRFETPAGYRGLQPSNVLAVGEGGIWVLSAGGLAHIDPATRSVASFNPITPLPHAGGIALAVGEHALWVSGSGPDGIGVVAKIDAATFEPIEMVRFGKTPGAIAVGLNAVWTVDEITGELVEIDPATVRVRRSVSIGGSPSDVAVGAGAVWVTDRIARTLTRFVPGTKKLTSITLTGADSVAAGLGEVWVIDTAAGSVLMVDPDSLVVDSIRVGRGPIEVATGAGFVWVANAGDGTVSRVDPRTREVTEIHVGGRPAGVTTDDEGAWVLDVTGSR
jgi:YVTN family beta-propeller protein